MRGNQLIWPTGRLNRAPYWIINIPLNGIMNGLERAVPNPTPTGELIIWILTLMSVYLGLCLLIGRLHDIDRSGWWAALLLLLISCLGLYGSVPDPFAWAAVIVGFIGIGFGLYVSLKPGTVGPNRFGPDPIARNQETNRQAAPH